jgi:hypothetical protein
MPDPPSETGKVRRSKGSGWGKRTPHRGPEAVSEAIGATFSDRPSAAGPRYVFSPAVTPFLVDQLQGQQAQQRRGGRDHAGAGVAGLFDQFSETQLRQERPEDKEAGNACLERRHLLLERT